MSCGVKKAPIVLPCRGSRMRFVWLCTAGQHRTTRPCLDVGRGQQGGCAGTGRGEGAASLHCMELLLQSSSH